MCLSLPHSLRDTLKQKALESYKQDVMSLLIELPVDLGHSDHNSDLGGNRLVVVSLCFPCLSFHKEGKHRVAIISPGGPVLGRLPPWLIACGLCQNWVLLKVSLWRHHSSRLHHRGQACTTQQAGDTANKCSLWAAAAGNPVSRGLFSLSLFCFILTSLGLYLFPVM